MKSNFMPILMIMAVILIVGVIGINYNSPSDSPVSMQDVSSNILTVSMPFNECRKSISKEVFDKVGTQNKIVTLADNDSSKMIKVCTQTGSIEVTCNADNNTRVTVETDNKQGC